MGTITQGINGAFSGKVGSIIGSSWKGVGYMRALPSKVANPKTAGQVDHRAKFAAIVRFMRALSAFLRIGFYSETEKMSGFNAAVSYNYHHALTGTYPDFEIDYSKVLVSCGTLPGALNPTINLTTPSQLEFTWEDNSNGNPGLSTDRVLLVAYDPNSGKAVTAVDGSTREEGSHLLTIPSMFKGKEVKCYIAFGNARELTVSNSQFVGGVLIR